MGRRRRKASFAVRVRELPDARCGHKAETLRALQGGLLLLRAVPATQLGIAPWLLLLRQPHQCSELLAATLSLQPRAAPQDVPRSGPGPHAPAGISPHQRLLDLVAAFSAAATAGCNASADFSLLKQYLTMPHTGEAGCMGDPADVG